MIKLVLLRHGESVWNKENRFTGWTDVGLSENGIKEAHTAGKLLKEKGYEFDIAFTSALKRAQRTLDIVLEEMQLKTIPVVASECLNERHYGDLQGLNKSETAQKYGEAQVALWRRSYAVSPPSGESLKDTVDRVVPYWTETVQPCIQKHKRALIAAHGNSLRALVKHLDNISDEEIVKLEIPTGIPLVYEMDENLKPLKSFYLTTKCDNI